MNEGISTQIKVVGALILRDVGTRFGRRPIAYLMVLLLPVGQFVLTAGMWVILKRPVPLGSSNLVFFATGLLPFIVWTFPYRQIAMAVNLNRPLLYFSRVKIVDIMVARSILEVITGFVVILVLLLFVALMGEDISPRDPFMTFFALVAAMYFGVGFGMLNGLIAAVYQPWQLPMMLFSPLMWGLSGAMFMVNTIPSPYREWLALNPVLQCVEWIRESYYWDYRSEVLDRAYVLELSTIMIAMALLIERLMRGRVLQG